MPRPPLRPQVILLGFAALLNDTASELIYPLLPVFLTTTLGATPAVVGLVEGVSDGLASILKYVSGAWSDRARRRKPLIVWGYSLAAASRLLIAAATVWPLVLTARLVDRTGKGMRSAPRDALISDVTPREERGRAFGFHRALDHTGAIAGPLLALLLLSGLGLELRTVFALAIVPGAIGVVMLAVLLRDPNVGPLVRSSVGPGSAATDQPTNGPTDRRFRHALTSISLFSLANSSDAFLLLQAHASGVPTSLLPLLWAAHHVIKSLFSTRAGALSDRMDRRHLLAAGWLVYAAIYFCFPFASTLTSFFVLFVVYAVPFTMTEGAERAWIADLVPPESRGRSFGMYYLANGAGVLAGSALFGLLYEQVSARAAFNTGAALAIAAAVVVLVGHKRAGARVNP